MMENNIFKNAYLGKAYRTRDNRKVVYWCIEEDEKWDGAIVCITDDSSIHYNEDGTDYFAYGEPSGNDIIEEWESNTTNKYKLMWDELWNVIVPPNSSICEQNGAKIMHSATNILHKYFPPLNPM